MNHKSTINKRNTQSPTHTYAKVNKWTKTFRELGKNLQFKRQKEKKEKEKGNLHGFSAAQQQQPNQKQ